MSLAPIEVISVRREPLNSITQEEVVREGFPGRSPKWFVHMFQTHNNVRSDDMVTRIEFKRLPWEEE